MKLQLFTDGGARGNPGPAAVGIVIKDLSGRVVREYNKYIGIATNNQAEYQALLAGLVLAKQLQAEEVECFLDSELVVKQLNREYRVKDKDLASWFVKIWNFLPNFNQVIFKHLNREHNQRADALVNQALDQKPES